MQFGIFQYMGLEQQSLFDIYNYINKPARGSKVGVKRGPYNKNKIKNLNPWTEMNKCYKVLADYCPLPIFNSEDSILENNGLRLWHTVYKNESYDYFGEIVEGEEFKVIEAEIIGTELLPIEWRLFLHITLLDFLKDGFKLNDIMSYIYKLLEWYKSGLLLKDLVLYFWTVDCEVLNG